jgi:membrane-associated phospholipid phosphatase
VHRSALTPLGLPLRTWPVLAVGILLLILTIVGGFIAKSFGQSSPELNLLVALSRIRVPVLDAVALGIQYGFEPLVNSIILAVICLGLLWPLRDPLRALAFGSIASVGWVSSELGKYTVLRVRPPHSTVRALILETSNDSFPSGHTAFGFSLVVAVILVLIKPGVARRLAIVAGALAVMVVGLSRLYLGVHYPTDIAGSVLISTAALMVWLPIWNLRVEPALLHSSVLTKLSGAKPTHRMESPTPER